MDERLEHVEAPDRADAGIVKLCLPKAAPVPQHREENLPGVFVPTGHGTRTAFRRLASVAADRRRAVLVVREIDLREDLDHGSPARFHDPDVVLRVEATVPERENGPAPAPFVGLLRERESLQITLFVLTQSGQRVVLPRRYGMTGSLSYGRRARARDKVAEAAYDSRVDTERGVRAADERSRS